MQERLTRLLLPLVAGVFTLIPPQVYVHELQAVDGSTTYLQFYPRFFDGIRPEGHFEWARFWFFAYLLVITVLCLPLMLKLNQQRIIRVQGPDQTGGPGFFSLLLLALPLMLSESLLRARWPGFPNLYNDWAISVFNSCSSFAVTSSTTPLVLDGTGLSPLELSLPGRPRHGVVYGSHPQRSHSGEGVFCRLHDLPGLPWFEHMVGSAGPDGFGTTLSDCTPSAHELWSWGRNAALSRSPTPAGRSGLVRGASPACHGSQSSLRFVEVA
jgi:hypothetical protein